MYKLTCDSHVSVVFAFVYGVHDLLRTANKTLGTPLGTHAHHKEMLCSTAPQQDGFTERQLLAEETTVQFTRLVLAEGNSSLCRPLITSVFKIVFITPSLYIKNNERLKIHSIKHKNCYTQTVQDMWCSLLLCH